MRKNLRTGIIPSIGPQGIEVCRVQSPVNFWANIGVKFFAGAAVLTFAVFYFYLVLTH